MSNIESRRSSEIVGLRNLRPVMLTTDSGGEQGQITWGDRQLDRQRQSHHILTLRRLERSAIELAAEKAVAAYVQLADAHSRRQVLSEAKWELYRAHKESQIIAGDDAELKAKFTVLDDDYFMRVRLAGME
ncbi:hypothetical protein [Geodermatophilus sp. DSM 45219]|uniref:hypothetical protein n=1 Tax=Geodermatophilus sp. DSM 45219 TaxID=1881103 RepID=UPI00088E2188|nr:hypothetical protein [Geodermatophilus sp. DSM 45219]SDN38663.1 hypothetical protein SAMN05428965_0155 [Geodermatophilus sp. DSM 45219]